MSAKFPGSELEPALTAVSSPAPDGSAGLDLYIEAESVHQVFAGDVPRSTTRVLAAGQRPLSATAFTGRATSTAWHTIPSWDLIATKDRLPLLSCPDAVADIISAAARGVRP
ncbi:hypothetical protein [Streptomyces sp. A30]|uniref:hypothetical protein n=1 Tax=Streptomyces sp. A30 TaxID=2789273 RepID=UPI0039803134